MCLTPISVRLPTGKSQTVACRKCRQCRDNHVRDWVGRCIAESKTAVGASFITLTYGNDDRIGGADHIYEAQVLVYADVQRWLKRLRNSGHPARYMCAGEYGSKKGRAHWHVVAFWQERVPNHPHCTRWWDDPFWSRHAYQGHSYWDEFTPDKASYVCKYILKPQVEDVQLSHQSEFHFSNKPALGHAYFMQLAERYVEQGLQPQTNEYWFEDVRLPDGMPRRFALQGVSLDNFCAEVIRLWERKYGRDPFAFQHSALLMEYLDRKASRTGSGELELRKYSPRPFIGTGVFIDGQEVKPSFDDRRKAWWYVDPFDGLIMWWSFNEQGERAWRNEFVTETEARSRSAEARSRWAVSASSETSVEYRNASQTVVPFRRRS